MARGRKPLPTALKILRNTNRPDRRRGVEPRPPAGRPEPPPWLSTEARPQWDRLAPTLEAMGILTVADADALALYCGLVVRMIAAEAALDQQGMLVPTGNGGVKINPHWTIASRAKREMLRILVEFGATPSSRSRVNATPPTTPDELAEFLRRKP